tara:strand:- start:390 stop:1397 length:1008 start_codon:yes stop_codon:yes gene_type:complete
MLQKLEQLYINISNLGLSSYSNQILNIIKFAEGPTVEPIQGDEDDSDVVLNNVSTERTYVVVGGDNPTKIVEKNNYKQEPYVYNGYRITGCINSSGLGEALMEYNNTSSASLRPGQSIVIPSLQYMVSNYNASNAIVQDSCVNGAVFNSYINSIQGQSECPRSDNAVISDSNLDPSWTPEPGELDTRQLPALIKCILNYAGMSQHYHLFQRLIWRESRSQGQSARSRANAVGFTQTINGHEEIARMAGIDISNYDIEGSAFDNIMFGALYFKYLLQRYNNDPYKALAAYNWGPGNLNSALRGDNTRNIRNWFTGPRPSFLSAETYGYVREIMQIQ